MMMMDTMDASQQSQPMDVAPAVAVAATTVGSAALVDFTATMVSMAATAEAETGTSESNNNHIDMAEYKEHRKNKKKKREKREREGREGKEHRHHKHREHREHREHRRHRDRDRDRERERETHHHHHQQHHHHHPNSSQHSTSASSSPSSASTTPSATIEYVGGSASASPSYLGAAGGGATGSGGGGAATTTYPHNLKIRFLLSGQRTELSPPTHQTSATAEVNAPLSSSTSASIAVAASATAAAASPATGGNTSGSNAGSTGSGNSSGGGSSGGLGSSSYPKTDSAKASGTGSGTGSSSNSSANISKHGSNIKESSSNQQPGSGSSSNAPSLYVSVPLSTANVPGINLPANSSSNNPSSDTHAAGSRGNGTQLQPQQSHQSNPTSMSGAFHGGATSGSPSGGSSSVIQHQSGKSSPALGTLVSGNSGGSIISASGGNLTATTTESGNLKISFEKQTTRVQQLQEQEAPPARRSRTPDLGLASSISSLVPVTTAALATLTNQLPLNAVSSGGSSGGLKFTYESQTTLDVQMLPVSAIKDSPPSSPGSEVGLAIHTAAAAVSSLNAVIPASATAQPGNVRKRGRKAKDSTIAAQAAAAAAAAAAAVAASNAQPDLKDVRILQNGAASGSSNPASSTPTPPATPAVSTPAASTGSSSIITHTAAHMLGNQINPNSSVAQKLSEQLHMEVQDHSIYTPDSMNSQYAGVPFPGKQRNSSASTNNATPAPNPLQSMFSGGGINGNMPIPQSLEQLLERQWEQGSQFLMEQAQHFDIASLLNCLHQLQSENLRLEEHVTSLIARRDHLLAVNARLQIPLNTIGSNAKTEAHGK